MLDLFKIYVLEQWRMILTNAPVPFFMSLAVIAMVIWLALAWGYGRELSLLKQQVADYKDKLSGATPDQAKARIDELERKLTVLERQVIGRRLTPEQRQIIENRIRAPSGDSFSISIVHEGGCVDCPNYGADFERVLRAAGWIVRNGMIMGPGYRSRPGLAMGVADIQKLAPEQIILKDAFQAAGVDFELFKAPRGPMGPATELIITARAPD
jgi:hypothetical protein